MVKLHNTTQSVDNALCEDAGLEIPDAFESCGQEECPRWVIGSWTLCQRSRCIGRNTAIQKRDIVCRFPNDTHSNKCDEGERPLDRQECYNELCKGVWRVEPWSQVGNFVSTHKRQPSRSQLEQIQCPFTGRFKVKLLNEPVHWNTPSKVSRHQTLVINNKSPKMNKHAFNKNPSFFSVQCSMRFPRYQIQNPPVCVVWHTKASRQRLQKSTPAGCDESV